eukprot:749026-Hanusia_phi.AAC.1
MKVLNDLVGCGACTEELFDVAMDEDFPALLSQLNQDEIKKCAAQPLSLIAPGTRIACQRYIPSAAENKRKVSAVNSMFQANGSK